MKLKIFLLTLLLMFMCSGSYAADIVLITDKSNSVDKISATDAKNIFLGKKKRWDDGSIIIPIVQKDQKVADQFNKTIVKKTSSQFDLFWRKAVFTGTGAPPTEVEDNDAMKKMVTSKTGAIGYITADALDDTVKKVEVQ